MLGQLILRNRQLRRDEPAIVFEGRTLTHGEFAARAFRLTRALAALGIEAGDRVAILAQNCPEYLEVYAAGELGGWATVTINYRLTEPEVAYILGDSTPKALICEAALLNRIGAAARLVDDRAAPCRRHDDRVLLGLLRTALRIRELALELHPVAQVGEDPHRRHLPAVFVEDGRDAES